MNLVQKVFGTHSERELKRIESTVKAIEDLRPAMQALSDAELSAKTEEFKKRLGEGETLDDLLPEAFAAVREAARRVLNTEHYRVQLIGGIILHQGRIAEMKTGEGKTQVATLPAYLNALEGKGVCVVTVNDYLAKRDSEWMGEIYKFMGLTVGVVLNSMKSDERREAYNCDITYVTNNELGFDYLRDNMVIYKEQLVLRSLNYAIIDEVDSVLIDEARTPLIISGQSGKSTRLYEVCDVLARQLKRGEDMEDLSKMDAIMGVEREETGDFIVNEKDKVVNLTAQGVDKVEKFFQIENLADPENIEIQHNMLLALRANNLMFRDQDYVVKDDQVLIVDEFTGRIMPGRRYSDGLHQAIEAKEHVKVKRESKTLATITFQNFFNKFDKKAGMTGTALTEEREFRDIYGMDVIEIPTNKPVARKDLQDAVYKTRKEKLHAIVEAVKESHAKGQPVLHGKDGYIEEFFERTVKQKFAENEHGKVDYFNLNLVQNVEKGEVICRSVPPVEGVSGRTVQNKEISCRTGKAVQLPKGQNTEISKDGTELLAVKSGRVEFSGRGFQVKSVLEISGNVDFSTGNINFVGDVHIHGDVSSGFRVHTIGDITIDGVVEAAEIEAGGNLIVAKGISGDSRAVIRAHHDIYAMYMENCSVHSNGNIQTDCIVNCDVYCDGEIQVRSGRGTIVGGRVRAARGVSSKIVGSRSESITTISLGGQPCADYERESLLQSLDALEKEMEKVEKQPESPARTKRMAKIRLDLSVGRMKLGRFDKELKKIQEQLEEQGGSKLKCDVAYPGMILNIGEETMHLTKETSMVHARMFNGEIILM